MSERGIRWLLHDSFDFKTLPPATDYDGFGKALLTCANGDGRITAAERAWVLGYLDAYGCPEAVLERLAVYDGKESLEQILASSPTVKLSATSALYDAIRACYADGELSSGELAALETMAKLVEVDRYTLRQLIEHYHEEQHLRGKRLRLLYPHGNPFPG